MLFVRGKARWVEEYVALYLLSHHFIAMNEIAKKIYDATGNQVTISTIRNVVYEMKNWGYVSTNNISYGLYTMTSEGKKYYNKDFENSDFTLIDPSKVNAKA